MTLKIEELPPGLLEKLGLERPEKAGAKKNKPAFAVEEERRYAIRVLSTIEALTQSQRARVLRRAIKLNEQ